MHRRLTPEIMDDPGVDQAQLAHSLAYIRGVNRWLGGRSALLTHLRRWSRDWPRDRPVTLLDVATGSADLPLAARAWAAGAGFDLRITAIDAHPKTVALARAHVAHEPAITIIQADALELDQRFAEHEFDYAHTGLFLHHLPDEHIIRVLRSMRRAARRAIIWNDLVRSRLGLAVIHAMTVGQPLIIRHDARVSVRAGFTRREALDLAQQAGLDSPRYRWNLFTHRFTLTDCRPQPGIRP